MRRHNCAIAVSLPVCVCILCLCLYCIKLNTTLRLDGSQIVQRCAKRLRFPACVRTVANKSQSVIHGANFDRKPSNELTFNRTNTIMSTAMIANIARNRAGWPGAPIVPAPREHSLLILCNDARVNI